MEPYNVLINKNSGTVLRMGEENIAGSLRTHFSDKLASPHFLETQDMPEALEEIAKAKSQGVVVGGGDGTAVMAAEILGPSGVPFAVLPLGTMNLLAQDLGSAPNFEETVQRLRGLTADKIDVGMVNDQMFLCSAVIGLVPESAVVREELREEVTLSGIAAFLGALRRGIAGDLKSTLYLKSNPTDQPYKFETTSLIISNNPFKKTPAEGNERFARDSLKEGKLSFYSAAPKDMLDGLNMALHLWQGDWQDHDSVKSFDATSVIVGTDDKKILVSLDGEPREMKGPLHFRVVPQSLPVLRLELSA